MPLPFSIDCAEGGHRLTLQFDRYSGVVNVIVTEEGIGQRAHATHGWDLFRAVRVRFAPPVVLRFDLGVVGFIGIRVDVLGELRKRVAQDRALGVVDGADRFVLRVGEVRHTRHRRVGRTVGLHRVPPFHHVLAHGADVGAVQAVAVGSGLAGVHVKLGVGDVGLALRVDYADERVGHAKFFGARVSQEVQVVVIDQVPDFLVLESRVGDHATALSLVFVQVHLGHDVADVGAGVDGVGDGVGLVPRRDAGSRLGRGIRRVPLLLRRFRVRLRRGRLWLRRG